MADLEAKIDKILEQQNKQSIDIATILGKLETDRAKTEILVNQSAINTKNYIDANFVANHSFSGLWIEELKKNEKECREKVTFFQRIMEGLWKVLMGIVSASIALYGYVEIVAKHAK